MGSLNGSGNDSSPVINENPTSDFARGDTQPFDSPSQLHDKLVDDDWNSSDWQWLANTVPFDDTYPVENNFETQELNFGAETQVLDNLYCFEDVETQLLDGFDQIVNDSGGEGSNRTGVLVDDENVGDKLRSGECDTEKREKSSCSPLRENNEAVLIAQNNKMTAKPRISGPAPRFTSVRAASLRAAGLAARNSALRVMKNNESNTKCSEEAVRECDTMISQKEVKDSSSGNNENRCPSAVRELFTENIAGETQGLNDKNDSTGGREEAPQFSHFDGAFAGLSYVDSQEPGESSQADALACVQRLIDENKELFENDLGQGKRSIVKSNCTSNVEGPQRLAKKFADKSITGKPGIFDWDDDCEDEGGEDILHRRKEESFGRRNLVGRFLTNPQKSKEKSKLQNEKVFHSDSKLIHNVEAIEKAAKENGIRRNLACEFNEHSQVELLSRQSDATLARNNVPEMHNVGLDTQIAAEAMEALFHGEGNANHNAIDPQQGLTGDSMDSSKRHRRRKTSGLKECYSNNNWDIGVATRQSKRTKGVVAVSGKSTLNASHENCENHEIEFCSNTVTRSKRAKSISNKSVVITGRKMMEKVTSKSENIMKLGETTEKPQLNKAALSSDRTVNKQRLVEKFATYTPIARRTRRNSFEVSQLKNAENVVSGSEAADHPLPLVLGLRVETFNASTGERNFSELGSCPRKKISPLDFSDQHRRPDNLSVQSKPKATISISGNKRSRKYAGISIADTNMKRITRSSSSKGVYLQNRNPEVEVCPQGVDKPVSADTTNGQKLSTNLKGRKSIGQLDRNSDRVPRLAKSNKRSSSPGKAGISSESACTPPAGCVTANAASPACVTSVDAASPICAGDGYVTPSCKKNLSRSSIMRESNSLCFTPEPPLNDLRKRRDLASIRILFSQHLDDDLIKQLKKIADRLKVQVVSYITDATHFITDNFLRTRNMLEAIASGKPIVTPLWLQDVGQANYYIDEHKYILRDTKREKELGFNMICSLVHARQNPLLQGRRVLITPNVKPGKEIISSLVKAVSGQAVERVGRSTLKDNLDSDNLLILSCEEDYQLCVPFLEKGATVYSSELLLNGIVIQKLEYERYRLFADHVKRTRSTMWLKKDGNKFIPVSRK